MNHAKEKTRQQQVFGGSAEIWLARWPGGQGEVGEDLTTDVERALNMCHSCVSVLVLICGGSQHYLPLCLRQGSQSAAGMWKYTEFLEVALWGQSIKTFSQNNFVGMMSF